MGVRSPLLFLHSHETRCADVVTWTKDYVIPYEVPLHFFGNWCQPRVDCFFVYVLGGMVYVLGGMDLSLRLLLVVVVDVTRLHVSL